MKKYLIASLILAATTVRSLAAAAFRGGGHREILQRHRRGAEQGPESAWAEAGLRLSAQAEMALKGLNCKALPG
jgi:hypothetical protein